MEPSQTPLVIQNWPTALPAHQVPIAMARLLLKSLAHVQLVTTAPQAKQRIVLKTIAVPGVSSALWAVLCLPPVLEVSVMCCTELHLTHAHPWVVVQRVVSCQRSFA